MKTLLYVGNFDTIENAQEQRNFAPSAANKMRYICSAANRIGWAVKIVSPSGTKGKRICKGKTVELDQHLFLKLFYSFAMRSKFERVLRVLFLRLQLFVYLLMRTKKDQPVLVYHSLSYIGIIKLLKRIKKFRLILEVEEIYADVTGKSADRSKEYSLFSMADSYLFSTELLNEKINKLGKPAAIVYGTYQTEKKRNNKLFEGDGRIHCVYAGTLDPRKGGAQAAIQAAAYLPKSYCVHILGFGSAEQRMQIEKLIKQVNALQKAEVTFNGLLLGDDYFRFLQSCEVGMSTQIPDAAFQDTSFPSKVLSYLSNGLSVVSVRLSVLERSKINGLLTYYDENSPETIANAVLHVDFRKTYDCKRCIDKLDQSFCTDFQRILLETR